MLAGIESDIIHALSEIALNILRGNVQLSRQQVQRLQRHKQALRALASRAIPLRRKRALLLVKQRGGFLPLLLPLIASIL